MDESGFTSQLRYAIDTMTSPLGAIAVFCWLMLLFAELFSPKVKWWALVALMWCAVVSFYLKEHAVVALAFPLDQIRNQGRTISTALLIALLLPALSLGRGWRLRLLSGAVICFVIFEMLLAIRIIAAGVADRGIVSFFIYVLMFIVLAWGCSKWVQTWDDAHKMLRCIVGAGAVNIAATCYQLLINRSAAIVNNRLMGVCGNPQEMAMVVAVTLIPATYLFSRRAEPKFWRVFCGIVAGMQVMLLLWTGSRTGILVAATGITAVFWSRLGRFVAVGLITGLIAYLAIQLYSESTVTIAEMFQRGNTRSQVWRQLWEAFVLNPAFGAMEGSYGTGESSYLSVAAGMGFFGLVPLIAFLVATFVGMFKLVRVRSALGGEKPLVDMIIGGIVSLLVGAIFEAYLLGTLVLPVFALIIYLSLMIFVIDAVAASAHQAQLEALEPGAGQGGGEFDSPHIPYGFETA